MILYNLSGLGTNGSILYSNQSVASTKPFEGANLSPNGDTFCLNILSKSAAFFSPLLGDAKVSSGPIAPSTS